MVAVRLNPLQAVAVSVHALLIPWRQGARVAPAHRARPDVEIAQRGTFSVGASPYLKYRVHPPGFQPRRPRLDSPSISVHIWCSFRFPDNKGGLPLMSAASEWGGDKIVEQLKCQTGARRITHTTL